METLHGFGKTPLKQGLEVMETENCVICRPTRRWHTTLISRSGGFPPQNVGILMGSVLWCFVGSKATVCLSSPIPMPCLFMRYKDKSDLHPW